MKAVYSLLDLIIWFFMLFTVKPLYLPIRIVRSLQASAARRRLVIFQRMEEQGALPASGDDEDTDGEGGRPERDPLVCTRCDAVLTTPAGLAAHLRAHDI